MDIKKYNELTELISTKGQLKSNISEVKRWSCVTEYHSKVFITDHTKSKLDLYNLSKQMSVEDINKHLEVFKALIISDLNEKLSNIEKKINKFTITNDHL